MSRSAETKLKALYARIPETTSPCVDGCRQCCGPVPMTRAEWERVKKAYPHEFEPGHLKDGTRVAVNEISVANGRRIQVCPFIQDGPAGCAIYPDRPLMCRLFATTYSMHCQLGCKASPLLTRAEYLEIMDEYYKIQKEDR